MIDYGGSILNEINDLEIGKLQIFSKEIVDVRKHPNSNLNSTKPVVTLYVQLEEFAKHSYLYSYLTYLTHERLE
jgi:hypothetical protein